MTLMEPDRTIAVFSPNFEGPFHGEFASQLRQLCNLKGYKFICVSTETFNSYNSLMSLNSIDGVILLRNAITNELASYLIKRRIAVVSLAYDYFPLEIPVVASDPETGIELAVDYLVELKHRDILYVGDLTNFDLRRRYESFCRVCENNQIEVTEQNLLMVGGTDFNSGYDAGKKYLANEYKQKAIIFGAGLTGLGFKEFVKKQDELDESSFDIVIYDCIPITPVLSPELASIDQNIMLMAHKSLEVIDAQIENSSFKRDNKVIAKLIKPIDFENSTYESYLSTCVELPSLYNANYMKSVLSNFHECINQIIESNLDDIMMVSPLFSNFMTVCTLGRFIADKSGRETIHLSRVYKNNEVIKYKSNNKNTIFTAPEYPPIEDFCKETKNCRGIFHFIIKVDNRSWGVLSIYGNNKLDSDIPSSFFAFNNYMEIIRDLLVNKIEKDHITKKENNENNEEINQTDWKEIKVTWAVETNTFEWDKESLELIGYTSELEKNIYKNMEISDKYDERESEVLRLKMFELMTENKKLVFYGKMKKKNGDLISSKIESLSRDGEIVTMRILIDQKE